MTDPIFRKVERRVDGEWCACEFENLKRGDIFRYCDGLGPVGPFHCLTDATPVAGDPDNYQVISLPAEASTVGPVS